MPVEQMHEEYEALLISEVDRTHSVMDLLREVVMDVWTKRQSENAVAQDRIDDHLKRLGARKNRLLDAYLDGKIDQETFEDKKASIEAQICLAKCERHDEALESLDIEATLLSAERILRDALSLWRRLPLAEKRRLDRLLFPEGVEYVKGVGPRTPVSNPAIELCERFEAPDEQMAPPRGIIGSGVKGCTSTSCDKPNNGRGTYMGRRSAKHVPDTDLAWLVNHWNHLPPEVKMTIMTVARNVLPVE